MDWRCAKIKDEMKIVPCVGCGGLFLDSDGPTHRDMESSSGCWRVYGEVLAREYSNPAYFAIHRLTVDSYAAQHPGHSSPQSIKSVGFHLIRLCLLLEHGLEEARMDEAMTFVIKAKERFTWLTPPSSLGSLTVADVHKAETAEQHKQLVRSWARSVWMSWSPCHPIIHSWLPAIN